MKKFIKAYDVLVYRDLESKLVKFFEKQGYSELHEDLYNLVSNACQTCHLPIAVTEEENKEPIIYHAAFDLIKSAASFYRTENSVFRIYLDLKRKNFLHELEKEYIKFLEESFNFMNDINQHNMFYKDQKPSKDPSDFELVFFYPKPIISHDCIEKAFENAFNTFTGKWENQIMGRKRPIKSRPLNINAIEKIRKDIAYIFNAVKEEPLEIRKPSLKERNHYFDERVAYYIKNPLQLISDPGHVELEKVLER